MTTGSCASANCSPFKEANSPTLLEYASAGSDSSSDPGGFRVSESEANLLRPPLPDYQNIFHRKHGWNYLPIDSKHQNFRVREPLKIQGQCWNPNGRGLAKHDPKEGKDNLLWRVDYSWWHKLPYSIPPLSKSLSSELQAGYNISLVDLQSRTRAESCAFCGENLRHGIHLDCKQNMQSTRVSGFRWFSRRRALL